MKRYWQNLLYVLKSVNFCKHLKFILPTGDSHISHISSRTKFQCDGRVMVASHLLPLLLFYCQIVESSLVTLIRCLYNSALLDMSCTLLPVINFLAANNRCWYLLPRLPRSKSTQVTRLVIWLLILDIYRAMSYLAFTFFWYNSGLGVLQ